LGIIQVGLLLLLAGLLLSATLLLLLTWLLAGSLVLLARFLVGIAHTGVSLVEHNPRQPSTVPLVAGEPQFQCDHSASPVRIPEPIAKTILYKPFG
jgi:hypothetical protein